MIQLGIRLHDVNTQEPPLRQTLEARAEKARDESFCCVHLALSKCIPGVDFDAAALNEGLAAYIRHEFRERELDIAVLGCYLNLAHPDPDRLRDFQARYCGHIRVAALAGAGVVGTETGAPNAAYKLDANTHTDAALHTFMRNLEPVVACAERYGVTVAIEPVWNHIVYNAARAREVLRSLGSPNLRIIFDPVNLLCPENLEQRDRLLAEAMDMLCDEIAVVHIKDYVQTDAGLKSVAAGEGEMDYTALLRFLKARKPYIQATLENTTNCNASAARRLIQTLYREV